VKKGRSLRDLSLAKKSVQEKWGKTFVSRGENIVSENYRPSLPHRDFII
jgi:hypothetical protein